jgi:hypothetical protein
MIHVESWTNAHNPYPGYHTTNDVEQANSTTFKVRGFSLETRRILVRSEETCRLKRASSLAWANSWGPAWGPRRDRNERSPRVRRNVVQMTMVPSRERRDVITMITDRPLLDPRETIIGDAVVVVVLRHQALGVWTDMEAAEVEEDLVAVVAMEEAAIGAVAVEEETVVVETIAVVETLDPEGMGSEVVVAMGATVVISEAVSPEVAMGIVVVVTPGVGVGAMAIAVQVDMAIAAQVDMATLEATESAVALAIVKHPTALRRASGHDCSSNRGLSPLHPLR